MGNYLQKSIYQKRYLFLDQTNLLELLHVLTSHSKIIFSKHNTDTTFIACLTHWLLVAGLQARNQHRKFSFSIIDVVNPQEEEYGTLAKMICLIRHFCSKEVSLGEGVFFEFLFSLRWNISLLWGF